MNVKKIRSAHAYLVCIICLPIKDNASALLWTICSDVGAGELSISTVSVSALSYCGCSQLTSALQWRKGLPRAATTALQLGNVGSQDHSVIEAGRGLRRYNQLLWGKSLGHTCLLHQRTQNTHSSDFPGCHLTAVQHGVKQRQEKALTQIW